MWIELVDYDAAAFARKLDTRMLITSDAHDDHLVFLALVTNAVDAKRFGPAARARGVALNPSRSACSANCVPTRPDVVCRELPAHGTLFFGDRRHGHPIPRPATEAHVKTV